MIETMHKLEFASQPENIAIIERLIDEIRDNTAFDDECYGDVLIAMTEAVNNAIVCLLYTSPSPRDRTRSRMPSSA